MPVRIVQSKQNVRLKELRRALLHPGRGKDGLAGIEGPNLIDEAIRSGVTIRTVYVAEESQRLLDLLPLDLDAEILLLPRELLLSALETENPQPIAALIVPPHWTWAHLLGNHPKHAPLIVVLAGLQDPGNLGTILRSAEAFGAAGIVTLPGTVNEWNPKAVRASAGSIFRLPVLAANAENCFTQLRAAGVKIWTTAMGGAEDANRIDLAGPAAILIGNEGNGVPTELAAQADGAISIPCPGPVESLNASVAASVLLYEASRQRAARAATLQPPGKKP